MGTYEEDAVAAVSALLEDHPEGTTDGALLGGKVNRVLAGTWAGAPAVFKYYGEAGGMHIGCPADRQRRDWATTGLVAGCPLVPRRLACFPEAGVSVFGRMPGNNLHGLDDRSRLRAVGEGIGAVWHELHGLPLTGIAGYVGDCCDGLDWDGSLERLLERSTTLAVGVDDPFLRESLARLHGARNLLADDPPGLARMDNNEGNFLEEDGRFTAILDWEQCWLATPSVMLGFLLDREAAGLPGIMAGYARAAGRAWDDGTWERILLAGELSAWWRILWNGSAWRAEHDRFGFAKVQEDWVERLIARITRLRELAPAIRRSLF